MTKWIDTTGDITPPRNRPLLAYCPAWCDSGYSVVVWSGKHFKCESHDEVIHEYVKQWSLFMEAD